MFQTFFFFFAVVILGVFAFLGVLVNLLLLFAIPLGKRTLFLPWLVFHLITVVGKNFKSFKKLYFLARKSAEFSLLLWLKKLAEFQLVNLARKLAEFQLVLTCRKIS